MEDAQGKGWRLGRVSTFFEFVARVARRERDTSTQPVD
jgi:hypothetical protein